MWGWTYKVEDQDIRWRIKGRVGGGGKEERGEVCLEDELGRLGFGTGKEEQDAEGLEQ